MSDKLKLAQLPAIFSQFCSLHISVSLFLFWGFINLKSKQPVYLYKRNRIAGNPKMKHPTPLTRLIFARLWLNVFSELRYPKQEMYQVTTLYWLETFPLNTQRILTYKESSSVMRLTTNILLICNWRTISLPTIEWISVTIAILSFQRSIFSRVN